MWQRRYNATQYLDIFKNRTPAVAFPQQPVCIFNHCQIIKSMLHNTYLETYYFSDNGLSGETYVTRSSSKFINARRNAAG